jgi:NADH:ubiquinone oxidoreductase subunit 6 (subunit J)
MVCSYVMLTYVFIVLYFRAMVITSSKATVSTKTVNWIILGLNSLLYMIFIIICLVFQYSQDNSKSVCPGRGSPNNNLNTQFTISVFYATFIAVCSLGISISLIIVGRKIVRSMSINKGGDSSKVSHFLFTNLY